MTNNQTCDLMIQEFLDNDVDMFFISPGSRSTNITVAIASNKQAKSLICYDERSAAFAALGYAKATKKTAVLVCTSGTALANYLPAVVEASISEIPMIILSADRPPELYHSGANQTINQVGIFGSYIREFIDLESVESEIDHNYYTQMIAYSIFRSQSPICGPVHINFRIREPFLNDCQEGSVKVLKSKYFTPQFYPSEDAIIEVESEIYSAKKILFVCSSLDFEEFQAVDDLAKIINVPIYNDASVSFCNTDNAIQFFDIISSVKNNELLPELIIQFGQRTVSKRLAKMLKNNNIKRVLVSDSFNRFNPDLIEQTQIVSDIKLFCEELIDLEIESKDGQYLSALKTIESKVLTVLNESNYELNEISAIKKLNSINLSDNALLIGNSMIIRYYDSYKSGMNFSSVYVNRGASGIDGLISTSIGLSIGLAQDVVCLIGDLSAIHDLNSLHLLTRIDNKLIIIVFNNHSGAIFRHLPISENQHFEEYFLTPHNFNFENAAKMFNLNYFNPSSLQEFEQVLDTARKENSSSIIEVSTDSEKSYTFHNRLLSEITKVIEK